MPFEEFDRISREEWLDKIKADLTGRPPEDLYWKYDEDIAVDPFVHADDPQIETSFVPRNLPWRCGDVFRIAGNEEQLNGQILEALNGGCESLHLDCSHHTDWHVLLREVRLDMIHTTIEYSGKDYDGFREGFLSFLQKQGIAQAATSISIRGDVDTGFIKILAAQNIIDGLVQGLIHAIEHPAALEIVVEIGCSYFIEIARLRAVRLLWHNLNQALEREYPLVIEAHFSEESLSQDIDQNMIKAGSMTMSAILGGADRIYTRVTSADLEPTSFHRRIARNVHHLLRYESRLHQLKDPVSGAYYIEKLTTQMVRKSWDRLMEQVKSGGR